MPQTRLAQSPGLSIAFEHQSRTYSPGDVIRGEVYVNTVDEVAIGRITVSFWGRVKSRIVRQNGESSTTYRGRTELFNSRVVLYEGRYTRKLAPCPEVSYS
jgi:hypothetical protein